MSIELMAKAWKSDLKTSSKMVLLALCDNANEEGRCFPSIPNIAKRCSMSTRSVQNQIAILVEKKFISKCEREGRSSVFLIANPCNWFTPANDAPLQMTTQTPANDDKTPAQFAGGGATGSPITITQSSHNHQRTIIKENAIDLRPDGVSQEVWVEFVKMRSRIKAPMNAYAVKLLVTELNKIGGDKDALLNKSILMNWKTVFPPKNRNQQSADKVQRHGFEQNEYSEVF